MFPNSPITTNPLVGASLLAKAPGQSLHPLPDPPLSRASSLPQVFAACMGSNTIHDPRHHCQAIDGGCALPMIEITLIA
jgi:hypothetical protein